LQPDVKLVPAAEVCHVQPAREGFEKDGFHCSGGIERESNKGAQSLWVGFEVLMEEIQVAVSVWTPDS